MTGRTIHNAAGASIPEPSIFTTNILSTVLYKNVIICAMTAEAVSFTISGKFFPLSGCVVMSLTGRAMGKENRAAKMLLGSLFVSTFDSYCSFCYNDDRKSLGGRYNGKIHHR